MTRLKLFAAALAASALGASHALAADMHPQGSMKDVPFQAPVEPSWTGFYLGGGIGGAVVDYDGGTIGTIDPDGIGVILPIAFGDDAGSDRGFVFGTAQIGYDRQLHSRFVVGLFADYDWNRDTDVSTLDVFPLGVGDLLTVDTSVELDNTWTIGGRLGVLATPSTLIYGLVGWTHGDLSLTGVTVTDIADVLDVTAFSASEEIDALTLGIGVETMLKRGLSLKVEYRYTDLDGVGTTALLDDGLAVGTADSDFDADIHSVRAVLTWRPGM